MKIFPQHTYIYTRSLSGRRLAGLVRFLGKEEMHRIASRPRGVGGVADRGTMTPSYEGNGLRKEGDSGVWRRGGARMAFFFFFKKKKKTPSACSSCSCSNSSVIIPNLSALSTYLSIYMLPTGLGQRTHTMHICTHIYI